MHRFGLFCFNVLVSVAGATVYAWAVRRDGMNAAAWTRALIEGGSAGFLSGVTVGLGATVGFRPPLPTGKCLWAQLGIAVSSLVGGAIAYMFPQVNGAIDEALAERGILRGSGVGLFIGTAWQFIQIYVKRRKSSR
ncbi:MAG: hypothetical protein HY293_08955 [Planctomycetes bacterium]|nr:hypothetical protein [Planctomycetota bacterium]